METVLKVWRYWFGFPQGYAPRATLLLWLLTSMFVSLNRKSHRFPVSFRRFPVSPRAWRVPNLAGFRKGAGSVNLYVFIARVKGKCETYYLAI